MYRLFPRLPHIVLASALVAVPAVAAAALDPTEPTFPRPLCIPHTPCNLPHPFTAEVDGPISLEVVASPGAPATPIQVQALSWSSAEPEPLKSADPQEGGQVYSADPEEGGEVVRPADPATTLDQRKAGHGPNEIAKSTEKTSAAPSLVAVPYPNTASRDAANGVPTGKRMHKPYALAEPIAKKGTVKVSVLAGACVKGQHFPEATITMRTGRYRLQDVDVAGCTTNGDGTDSCTLTYAALAG